MNDLEVQSKQLQEGVMKFNTLQSEYHTLQDNIKTTQCELESKQKHVTLLLY